jgi:hypothetical protein
MCFSIFTQKRFGKTKLLKKIKRKRHLFKNWPCIGKTSKIKID